MHYKILECTLDCAKPDRKVKNRRINPFVGSERVRIDFRNAKSFAFYVLGFSRLSNDKMQISLRGEMGKWDETGHGNEWRMHANIRL